MSSVWSGRGLEGFLLKGGSIEIWLLPVVQLVIWSSVLWCWVFMVSDTLSGFSGEMEVEDDGYLTSVLALVLG